MAHMDKMKKVEVPVDTLRVLKEAAWLWSCESVGNYSGIRKACPEAAMILEEEE